MRSLPVLTSTSRFLRDDHCVNQQCVACSKSGHCRVPTGWQPWGSEWLDPEAYRQERILVVRLGHKGFRFHMAHKRLHWTQVNVPNIPLKLPRPSLLLRKSGQQWRFECIYADGAVGMKQERAHVQRSPNAKCPRTVRGSGDGGLCPQAPEDMCSKFPDLPLIRPVMSNIGLTHTERWACPLKAGGQDDLPPKSVVTV